MLKNMIIFKSVEYSCLWICNVDDVKIIDWLCTYSNLIFQHKSDKHCTKIENKKHTTKRREIKTNIIVQRGRNHKNQRNRLFNRKKEDKTIWRGDFGSELTLNHSSSIDQEEEKWWQLWFGKTIILIFFFYLWTTFQLHRCNFISLLHHSILFCLKHIFFKLTIYKL